MIYGWVGSVYRYKAKIDHIYIIGTSRVGLERQWRWKLFPMGGAVTSHQLVMASKVAQGKNTYGFLGGSQWFECLVKGLERKELECRDEVWGRGMLMDTRMKVIEKTLIPQYATVP